AIDLAAASVALCRRSTMARVNRTIARLPRHRRGPMLPLVASARQLAMEPLSLGAERVLETLARAELSDEAWLRSVSAFAAVHARPVARTCAERRGVLAIILLQPSLQSASAQPTL